ncbi:MAG: hypothetical protein JJU24_15605 [Natronohydrobacter sp.]|nr:hypothetical protein [Natronohydrobacter sp.]
MTDIRFDRLTDLPLRDAWRHEALDFTPWLAQNIDHLSDAIGMPLELTGTEVAVESFSADILARNPMDDSVVLIENQLETTDHTHLGQIMTYLAGLEAQTVIWIAPSFRSPHLSAIRWLNEHTSDGFSFFAVKARVVRIGDSPFAPIFEVVEKPDHWQRKLKTETVARNSNLQEQRTQYFDQLQKQTVHYPSEVRRSRLCYPVPANPSLAVTLEVQRNRAMIFVIADNAAEFGDIETEIKAIAPRIEDTLGPIRETRWGGALFTSTGCDLLDPQSWSDTLAWHKAQITKYIEAFSKENGMT